MSKIAAQLREAATTRNTRPCIIGRFLTEVLDDEDRQVFEAMMRVPRKGAVVFRVLEANGLDASVSALGLHRRGECDCPVELPAEVAK